MFKKINKAHFTDFDSMKQLSGIKAIRCRIANGMSQTSGSGGFESRLLAEVARYHPLCQRQIISKEPLESGT